MFSTHNSWLPGDPRGFRSREHRIHSSGGYKNPPPKGEHAGLLRYAKKISGDPVVLEEEIRETIGRAILAELRKRDCRVLAIAVAATHVHILCELPEDEKECRDIVGRCKTAACYAVREQKPGRLWGRNATHKAIENESHHANTFRYILAQADAWTWSFKEEPTTSETEIIQEEETQAPDNDMPL
ncbi:MAG: transposase [Planctomycetes bacterium]|nr:transposase [Planctomycetota bacterium]